MREELPGGIGLRLTETLRGAGYRLESEKEIMLGVLALNAASLLLASPGSGSPGVRPSTARVGRNEKCPCGSGKKYKKCCLPRSNREKRALRPAPGDRFPRGVVVPNLTDNDSLRRDLALLEGLFDSDPDLRKVRFSLESASRFLEEALTENPPNDTDPAIQRIDEASQRYFREVEGAELIDGLGDRLIKAFARTPGTPEDIRCLALGIVLSRMACDSERPNPLIGMIFRKTVFEHVNALRLSEDILAGLGEKEDVLDSLKHEDPDLESRIRECAENIKPETLDTLKDNTDRLVEKIGEDIDQGRFPVPLPQAAMMPLMMEMFLATQKGKPDMRELQDILMRAVEAIDPEDLRLYGEILDSWLEQNDDGPDPDMIIKVRMVRLMVAQRSIYPLDFSLMKSGLMHKFVAMMNSEEDIEGTSEGEIFTPEYLERLGDFLIKSGYPALARRTWSLCGLLWPVPKSIKEKLGLHKQPDG